MNTVLDQVNSDILILIQNYKSVFPVKYTNSKQRLLQVINFLSQQIRLRRW